MRSLLLIISLVLLSLDSNADDGFSYAILDYEYIVQKSSAFAHLETKIEAKRKSFFTEAQRSEKFLTNQREELEKKCPSLSKEECESKLRNNSLAFDDLNNKYRLQRADLNDLFLKSARKIEEHISEIVTQKVKQKKYSMVFHRRALIHGDDSKDITEEVLSDLNNKFPDIKVE